MTMTTLTMSLTINGTVHDNDALLVNKKRNSLTNLPPFLTQIVTKSREIYTAKSGKSLVFQHFLACHSLMDTKTCYLTP
jgi:hypothetical protein